MVLLDGTPEAPLVETCVLLPEEFSLKVERSSDGTHQLGNLFRQLVPSLLRHPLSGSMGNMGALTPPMGDHRIKVCSTRTLAPQARYLPFSGTVRADKLPLLPYLPALDVSFFTCHFIIKIYKAKWHNLT